MLKLNVNVVTEEQIEIVTEAAQEFNIPFTTKTQDYITKIILECTQETAEKFVKKYFNEIYENEIYDINNETDVKNIVNEMIHMTDF